ncbi:hypothetical protein T4A_5183 [Trichinella pseudospiralis]|uniref:Uncharacterized protein n=1 Tax=Trichinella pseudospiralis TaxID=6337 RepID=A0A0V1DVI5_TRIPS|nr:hypothetical protein T4A_5183 [Trichinella pseudospiralis]KRY86623.1 hypothetical protein T4D_3684 [Trichinella pseudospiralis]
MAPLYHGCRMDDSMSERCVPASMRERKASFAFLTLFNLIREEIQHMAELLLEQRRTLSKIDNPESAAVLNACLLMQQNEAPEWQW